MNGQKITTKNFTVQTTTGKQIDYKLDDVEGINIKEKIDNAFLKLVEMNINVNNISAIYYNNVAYCI
jgi:hypothetical protein